MIGWTDGRAAQAEHVAVPAEQLTGRPTRVPWEQAGCLYVAGTGNNDWLSSVGVEPVNYGREEDWNGG